METVPYAWDEGNVRGGRKSFPPAARERKVRFITHMILHNGITEKQMNGFNQEEFIVEIMELFFINFLPRTIRNVRKVVKSMSITGVLLLSYWLFHSLV